jgi:hypothetical protein
MASRGARCLQPSLSERRSQSRSSPILVGQVQRRNRQKGTQFAPFSAGFFPRLRPQTFRHAARPGAERASRKSWSSREFVANRDYYTDVSTAIRAARWVEPLLPLSAERYPCWPPSHSRPALPSLTIMSPKTYFCDKTGRQTTTYVAKNVNSRQNSPRQNPQLAPAAISYSLQPSPHPPLPRPFVIRHSDFSHSRALPIRPIRGSLLPSPHSPFRALSCLWWFTLSVGRRAPDDHLR